MNFFCPKGDKLWRMVGGHGGGLYVTLRWSWPCVMHVKVACVIPQASWRGWQMLGVFLEAVTQEQGLPISVL